MKPQVTSCDPIEVMVDTPIVPNPPVPAIPEMLSPPFWFVKEIVFAQAAIGNAKASNPRTNTRLILVPPFFRSFPRFTPKTASKAQFASGR